MIHVHACLLSCFIHFPAVNPMDYLELNTILSFAACEIRRCVNVTIVDDLVDEPLEFFDYTLEGTPGLDSRITLDPVDGVVEITDNDGNTYYVLPFGECVLQSTFHSLSHREYYCWL